MRRIKEAGSKKINSNNLYGIQVKPAQSLQEIKEIWSYRTADTYTLLPLVVDKNKSLWRSIKTGRLTLWNDSMLSLVTKKDTPVVDSYILQEDLATIDFFRLSLEYITAKSTELLNCHAKNNTDPLAIIKDIYDEITINVKLDKIQSSLNAVKYYKYLIEEIAFLEKNPQFDSPEAQYIKDLEGRSRFWELNDKLQYSDWAANCLAIHEIENSELFRFEYKSLKEYVVKSNNLGFNYDEYLRRSKAGGVVKLLKRFDMKLPTNKSQAIALAEIPQENMRVVWNKFLEQPGRKSVKLISKIHEEILFGKQLEIEQPVDLKLTKAEIKTLLEKESVVGAVKILLESLRDQSAVSELELKIIKLIKRNTKIK